MMNTAAKQILKKKPLLLGCIADDLTGATDLANNLVQGGMRTLLVVGVPIDDFDAEDADAVVVALKSRTIPAGKAVAQSLASLRVLKSLGARQVYFKYCSTFDSTNKGNIGPVAEALREAVSADFTVACPAFPENGRTVFKGHLFVWNQLLSESSMRHHPLTPMTDANLVRVLSQQTKDKVGLVSYEMVAAGARSIREAFETLWHEGVRQAIVDTIFNHDLLEIADACRDIKLITGSSGLALGLSQVFRAAGTLEAAASEPSLPPLNGATVVLAGSCSQATQEQVAYVRERWPSFQLSPLELSLGVDMVDEAVRWAIPQLGKEPVLIYTTVPPAQLAEIQEKIGQEEAGALVEKAFGEIARQLVKAGVTRLLIAGGETSGAVVNALGINHLQVGPQIDPGVPWTTSLAEPKLQLALKSGNFGSTDFFLKALQMLTSSSK